MGLTKEYLRFVPGSVFGIIGSASKGGVTAIPRQKNLIASACAENVILWNLKTGEKQLVLFGEKHEITILACNPQGTFLAVGYHDGCIRIFDLRVSYTAEHGVLVFQRV